MTKPSSSVISIQSNAKSSMCIFCFPGAAASVTCFVPLAELLGQTYTVYGIQPRGLDGIHLPHGSVEGAVDESIESIRALNGESRYCLLGHSFGGWIALEAARQLALRGENVDTVILLDSRPPKRGEKWTRMNAMMRLIQLLEEKSGRDLGLSASELHELSDELQLKRLAGAMKRAGLLPRISGLPTVAAMVDVFEANLNTGYTPSSPFVGDMLLMCPKEQSMLLPGEKRDNQDGSNMTVEQRLEAWTPYARQVSIFDVPGSHLSMLDSPQVAAVAEKVRQCWDN